MVIQSNIKFIDKANSPMVSKIFSNSTSDLMSLQISGGPGKVILQGRIDKNMDWVTLSGIDVSNYTIVKDQFTKSGIYEISIIGIRQLRAILESSSGEISVLGQLISSEET